jgi:hypothetical protein
MIQEKKGSGDFKKYIQESKINIEIILYIHSSKNKRRQGIVSLETEISDRFNHAEPW